MSTSGEQLPDIALDPAIMDELKQIGQRRVNEMQEEIQLRAMGNYDADLPGYVDDLALFDSESEEAQTEQLTTLQEQRALYTFIKEHEAEVAQQSELLEPEARTERHQCIDISRKFAALSYKIAQEIIDGQGRVVPDDGLVALLASQARDGFEAMLRWGYVANNVLMQERTILYAMARQIKQYLSPQQRQEIETDIRDNPVDYADYIPGVRTIEGFIRSSRHDMRRIPREIRTDFPAIYKEWQNAIRLRLNEKVHEALNVIAARISYTEILQNPHKYTTELQALAEADAQASTAAVEDQEKARKTAEEARALQQELAAIIEAYSKKSAVFRPSWNQVQKAAPGIKTFSNELLRFGQQQRDAPPAKRLTRVLHALEQLGSKTDDPTQLSEKFNAHLTVEQLITEKITIAQEALAQAGMQADTSDWEPISADLDYLALHWKHNITEVAGEHWVPKTGSRTDALAAISYALTQYNKAKKEILHPEHRLAAIARSLGVVALPAEARPQTKSMQLNLEAKRAVTKKRFKEIREDMSVPEDMRERAAVIEHFLDLAESQRTPEDDIEFGDLFLTKSSEQHKRRYFGVHFRDEQQKEWVLLESLTPEAATFVIPMDLVRSLGSFEDFIANFGKSAQRELGSVYAQHKTGWTASSHIARITAKMAQQNT